MRPLPVLLAVAFLLTACGGDEKAAPTASGGGYPAAAETNFMDACKSGGGDESYCRCTLDEIKSELSYEEFRREDQRIEDGGRPGTALNDAATRCRKKASSGATGDDDGNDYPKVVRTNFLRSCEAKSPSERICRCTLEKIEARYSLEEFTQLEQRIQSEGGTPRELDEAVKSCSS